MVLIRPDHGIFVAIPCWRAHIIRTHVLVRTAFSFLGMAQTVSTTYVSYIRTTAVLLLVLLRCWRKTKSKRITRYHDHQPSQPPRPKTMTRIRVYPPFRSAPLSGSASAKTGCVWLVRLYAACLLAISAQPKDIETSNPYNTYWPPLRRPPVFQQYYLKRGDFAGGRFIAPFVVGVRITNVTFCGIILYHMIRTIVWVGTRVEPRHLVCLPTLRSAPHVYLYVVFM